MKIEASNFIVVPESRLVNKGKVKYSGKAVMIPLGEDIPLIVKGEGCFGITRVSRLVIDESGTVVEYESVSNIDKAAAKAYYALYRSKVSSRVAESSDDDGYEDQAVPGLYRPGKSSTRFI